MIKDASLEQLKAVVDIVDVVGSYIEIERDGAGFKAICPFHNERTASFKVNPAKNNFHCYGCGKWGNAIDFVIAYEKIGFQEAVEKLAIRYNIALERTNQKAYEEQKGLSSLLDQISLCYQETLKRTPHALEYLKGRGISDQSMADFQLGYCDSRAVFDFIHQYQLDKEALHHLGVLAFTQEGKEYASLFNRIIFPIQNSNGKIVAFGGRALGADPIKYINSATSAAFSKSKTLYGYPQARLSILKEQKILLTEGYIDVILAHQVGIKIAVATLGTALSPEHLPLLNILKERSPIIMAYDADNAGQEATTRAIELLSQNLKYGGVVELESGLDVADMVAQGKAQQLKDALDKPVPFIEYSLGRALLGYDLQNPLDFMHASRACFKALDRLIDDPNGIKAYEAWIKKEYGFERKPQQDTKAPEKIEGSLIEDLLLRALLVHPEYMEQISPYFDSKYFTFECNAQTYNDMMAGKPKTPHQIALIESDLYARLFTLWEQAGDILPDVQECALRIGRSYWAKYWRAEARALIGKNQTTRVFNIATHADLIERFCTLQNLPYMHIVPDLKKINPYQQLPESVWGVSYDPRKMVLAIEEHFARFGDQAYYSKSS
ncbi:DNA primase [Helicobacter sp. L8]|uniref:DNA primase n=1 Tax=Helicobacter sp. L8 TaxID=2316078 RepID=UPI000EB0A09B|nr:DNA primase [Helicobacter sp. L8]